MPFSKAHYLLLLLLILSCTTEYFPVQNDQPQNQAPDTKSYTDVDRVLWPYFEAFEEAAAEHKLRIDLEGLGITGEVEEISENGVAGTCQYGQHIHHVTIDQSFWNRFSADKKEMVVFHELGHCVLGRGHAEGEDANGSCLSIMNSGTSGCTVLYNDRNKAYYLAELFSED